MIVRVQSQNGTKRISAAPSEPLKSFLEKVVRDLGLEPSINFSLYRSPAHRHELTQAHLDLQLQAIPIRHGDMLYLSEKTPTSSLSSESSAPPTAGSSSVVEDEVDKILSTRDGKIERGRDSLLCRHPITNKCINCVPLEPWDKLVQEGKDPPIKHMSFHCYVRKLTSGVDRGKFAYLEDLSCKIKPGCTDHPAWPAGICTKCQPSAITLARQPYRHVDNVMFEDGAIVNHFIESWRSSGDQRMGYLIGHYEEFTDVPLGIRAVVSAIYEPRQECARYSVQLLEDPHDTEVQELAALLGLRKIGWIFTDLESEGNGKVAYKRSIHSHILSAEECIMTADFQNTFPSPCKLNGNGYFGSKFVTVCVSGDENNQIGLKGYQVSNQCMALVRDDCLVPTLDALELGYVRESTPEQYVPDVFYKTKDEYGEMTRLARPLPLEYLIIELTTTTPIKPHPLLLGGNGTFPVGSRSIQDFSALAGYLSKQSGLPFLSFVSDFNLLLFLYTTEVAGINFKAHLPELCHAIRHGDRGLSDQWKKKECWATLEQLIMASAESPTGVAPPLVFPTKPREPGATPTSSRGGAGPSGEWACKHCTLLNPGHVTECEACHLPP